MIVQLFLDEAGQHRDLFVLRGKPLGELGRLRRGHGVGRESIGDFRGEFIAKRAPLLPRISEMDDGQELDDGRLRAFVDVDRRIADAPEEAAVGGGSRFGTARGVGEFRHVADDERGGGLDGNR